VPDTGSPLAAGAVLALLAAVSFGVTTPIVELAGHGLGALNRHQRLRHEHDHAPDIHHKHIHD